jgi:lysozyme
VSVDLVRLYAEIASDEGKILHKYKCSLGHDTIGIGHLVQADDPEANLPVYGAYEEVSEEVCITEDRCYELFQKDIQGAIEGCKRLYSNWEDLPQEAQHVLVNMCFQLGQNGLSKFKKTNLAVEDKDYRSWAVNMIDSKWALQTPERARRLRNRVLTLASA